jgi:predicted phosphodiesterase
VHDSHDAAIDVDAHALGERPDVTDDVVVTPHCVHDTGPAGGRAARVRAQFPDVDVVVFGHSHIPWHETHVRSDGHVQHHVNPGSAMQARRQPHCTIAWLVLESGSVLDVRHEVVHTPRRNDRPAARRPVTRS